MFPRARGPSARARTLYLGLALVIACGSGEPPAATSTPAPSPSVATPTPSAVATTTVEVDAWPAPAVAMPGPAPSAPAGGPGFVVVAGPDDPHTLVVPLDPAVALRSADVMLVLDGTRRSIVALAPAEPEAWVNRAGVRPCPEGCERTCAREMYGWARAEIDPATFAITMGTDCGACVRTVVEDEDAEQDEEEDEEQDEGACFSAGGAVASIVGGRAFVPVDAHDECGGYNLYSLDLATFPVGSDAWAAPGWPHAFTQCDDGEHPDWGAFDQPFGDDGCARRASGTFTDCGFCSEEASFVVVTAWNGTLHYTGAGPRGGANGGSPMWRAEVPLRPRTCPSSEDPCGDPAPFASALGETSDERRFWITTPGSAALLIERDPARPGGSLVRVLRSGEATASREQPVPFAPRDVISVRFHADVASLARTIDHGLEALGAPSQCDAAAAPAPPPASTPPTTSATAGTPAPCELGARREETECVPLALAPEDATFEDPRGGSGWGDRCVAHLRAGELDAAEAACAHGLAVADRASTRGALLYNLGRVGEARGDRAMARRAYEQSLAVRPGNAPTQQALDALGD